MNEFLKLMTSFSWAIEKSWLEQLFSLANSDSHEALQVLKSDPVPNTYLSEIRGNTAHIPIYGPIFPRANILTEFFGIGISLSSFSHDFNQVIENDSIERVILDIDSPGGVVTGINEMSSIIKVANDKKEIIAYVGGTAASAAYWLASSAGEIVFDATARGGSIGVVSSYEKPDEDDWFVELVSSTSPNKRVDPTTDEGKAILIEELDALADVFIKAVAENRDVSVLTVMNDFGKGRVLVGQNAVDVGMADRLGSFEGLMAEGNVEKVFLESEGDNLMNEKELKEQHPDLYQSIVASMKSALQASIEEKDAEIVNLTKQLDVQTSVNETIEERMKALEKADTLRKEKDLQESAKEVIGEKILASDIPERLHDKVMGYINYNKFIVEGELNTEDLKVVTDKEIAYWEEELGMLSNFPVMGVSTKNNNWKIEEDVSGEESEAVERMLGHIGVKEDK